MIDPRASTAITRLGLAFPRGLDPSRLYAQSPPTEPREGRRSGGIEVTDRRNDAGLAGPMVDDIARRYGTRLLTTDYEDIVALAAHAAGPVSVYTPPPREKETSSRPRWRGVSASERRSPSVSRSGGNAWRAKRARLSTLCASASSGSDADRKNHGFGFLPVRGLIKAKAHALWHAIANNLMAARRLRIKTP